MRNKILIDLSFIRSKPYSGVAKYAYRIIDYIIQSGRCDRYALLLDIISEAEIKNRYPQFETKTIGNRLITKIPLVRTFWLQFSFKHFVNASEYDVVFCPWANQITCLKSKKIIISVIHDLQSLIDWKGFALYRDKCIYKAIIRNSRKIVTISEFSKRQILSFFPKADVVNLSNSVSMDITDIPSSVYPQPYILYVGRICKMKNIITLIRAFKTVSHENNSIKLVVVGQKNDYWREEIVPVLKGNDLEEKVEVLEGVSEKQLSALYRDAELFVFPSLREGFGFPPVEASLMETPVVSSKADSLEEVSLGLWYTYDNPNDYNELAKNIISVLQNPPSKDRLTYIKNEMLNHYTPSTVCKNICNYIESVS